jgi:hypothetical protein
MVEVGAYWVTLRGAVMARRPGKVVWKIGRVPPERARPTAPEDFTEPLKMSVCGRPVTKGVDDAKRPSFGFIDLDCKPEPVAGTNLGRMGKRRRQCLIETLRSVVGQGNDRVHLRLS